MLYFSTCTLSRYLFAVRVCIFDWARRDTRERAFRSDSSPLGRWIPRCGIFRATAFRRCCRACRSDCRGQPQVHLSGRCTDRHDGIFGIASLGMPFGLLAARRQSLHLVFFIPIMVQFFSESVGRKARRYGHLTDCRYLSLLRSAGSYKIMSGSLFEPM